jgi:hypothetical protein
LGLALFTALSCVQNTVQLMTPSMVHVKPICHPGVAGNPCSKRTPVDYRQYGPCNHQYGPCNQSDTRERVQPYIATPAAWTPPPRSTPTRGPSVRKRRRTPPRLIRTRRRRESRRRGITRRRRPRSRRRLGDTCSRARVPAPRRWGLYKSSCLPAQQACTPLCRTSLYKAELSWTLSLKAPGFINH